MFTLERQAQHVADAQRCVAPCRGNMSKMGQRPSTHTGAYRLNVLGAISVERIGRNTPIYIVSPTHTNPRFTPVVSRGVAPISTYCPYRARYLLNPVHGGKPRVSFTAFTIPWAEIPLPLQGATASKPLNPASKPPKDKQGVAASKPLNPASKPPKDKWSFSL